MANIDIDFGLKYTQAREDPELSDSVLFCFSKTFYPDISKFNEDNISTSAIVTFKSFQNVLMATYLYIYIDEFLSRRLAGAPSLLPNRDASGTKLGNPPAEFDIWDYNRVLGKTIIRLHDNAPSSYAKVEAFFNRLVKDMDPTSSDSMVGASLAVSAWGTKRLKPIAPVSSKITPLPSLPNMPIIGAQQLNKLALPQLTSLEGSLIDSKHTATMASNKADKNDSSDYSSSTLSYSDSYSYGSDDDSDKENNIPKTLSILPDLADHTVQSNGTITKSFIAKDIKLSKESMKKSWIVTLVALVLAIVAFLSAIAGIIIPLLSKGENIIDALSNSGGTTFMMQEPILRSNYDFETWTNRSVQIACMNLESIQEVGKFTECSLYAKNVRGVEWIKDKTLITEVGDNLYEFRIGCTDSNGIMVSSLSVMKNIKIDTVKPKVLIESPVVVPGDALNMNFANNEGLSPIVSVVFKERLDPITNVKSDDRLNSVATGFLDSDSINGDKNNKPSSMKFVSHKTLSESEKDRNIIAETFEFSEPGIYIFEITNELGAKSELKVECRNTVTAVCENIISSQLTDGSNNINARTLTVDATGSSIDQETCLTSNTSFTLFEVRKEGQCSKDNNNVCSCISDIALQVNIDGLLIPNASINNGDNNYINDRFSFASGTNNNIEGRSSAAIGDHNHVAGPTSAAIGMGNHIHYPNSFAAGLNLSVDGECSFAAGRFNYVYGTASAAFGDNTVTEEDNSFIVGKNGYIARGDDTVFAVANDDIIFRVSKNGDTDAKGRIRSTSLDTNTVSAHTLRAMETTSEKLTVTGNLTIEGHLISSENEILFNLINDGYSVLNIKKTGELNSKKITVINETKTCEGNKEITGLESSIFAVIQQNCSQQQQEQECICENKTLLNVSDDSVHIYNSIINGGDNNIVTGDSSFANGNSNEINSQNSAAFGIGHIVSGQNSVATGAKTIAQGEASFTNGFETEATGRYSFAAGESTHAKGLSSASFGFLAQAQGEDSFVSGTGGIASAKGSFACNIESVASARASFASGFKTNASGDSSFSTGENTLAMGIASSTFGSHTTTYENYSMIIGNEGTIEPGSGIKFAVANKGNIFTVDEKGNAYVAGTITINKPIISAFVDMDMNGTYGNFVVVVLDAETIPKIPLTVVCPCEIQQNDSNGYRIQHLLQLEDGSEYYRYNGQSTKSEWSEWRKK